MRGLGRQLRRVSPSPRPDPRLSPWQVETLRSQLVEARAEAEHARSEVRWERQAVSKQLQEAVSVAA